jgi:acyl-coenzyme A synthetase/AMP-(fatty) acid ligase/acyl carrier protein
MNENLVWQESIFSPPEKHKTHKSLPESLTEVVAKWPNLDALVSEGITYNFMDLANRAAGLAEEINQFSHIPGPLALLQKPGLDAIAAWFACSISGRPFLLLEPDHPPARLIELIKKSGSRLALVDHSTSHLLLNLPSVTQLISDGRLMQLQKNKGLFADDPALIFPTSGSTGNPKLITYSSKTIQVKVQSSIKLMRVPEKTKVLIAGSHSNYGFLHHALVFLFSGSTIYLSDIKALGFNSILDAILKNDVRHVRFTPSLFRKLAILPEAKKALGLLDAIRFSGEPLLKSDLQLAQSILRADCLIQNVYGSTESSLFIWSNVDDNTQNMNSTVPIGKIYPLSSYAIRKIDRHDKNTKIGELLLRSKYHAIGDFKEGLITKTRFPLLDKSTGERVYATGDVVEQLDDGNLIHLGRLGRMVKIRGNRVFLSEVEQQLRSIKGITAAVVLDKMEQSDTVIYGFVTTENKYSTSYNLRQKLSAKLPDFMIPKSILIIDKIPLMAGGKTDYLKLKTLISSPEKFKKTESPKDDYEQLIQIWDSVLWNGAHKYHSDFFSLGGDSLSYMILLADLEQKFKKTIRVEEFRANSTIEHLAQLLGVHQSVQEDVIKYKSLRIRLFSASSTASKGVAMSVPGYFGLSNAYPYYKAGFFHDYDIWVVEYPIENGNMLHENRWWKATQEIVQGVKQGIIPKPQIVFGFSFGGGLAWLLGRLLAGSTQAPKFILIVDAPPLHRRKNLRHKQLIKELNKISNVKMPLVLHIRRSPLTKFEYDNLKWNRNDNITKIINLPTITHNEMINWKLLSLATDAVIAFLNGKQSDFQWKSVLSPPNLMGSQIFYAINGNDIAFQNVMAELKNGIEKFNHEELINIAILLYNIDELKSMELVQYAFKKWPTYPTIHYLSRRIKRKSEILFYGDIPKFYSSTIVSVENRLISFKKTPKKLKPRNIRLLNLAFDVSCFLFFFRYFKLKNVLLKTLKKHRS